MFLVSNGSSAVSMIENCASANPWVTTLSDYHVDLSYKQSSDPDPAPDLKAGK